ncbi:triose-phosphate isomerase [Oceanibaculum indicum]|uniref:Triosephosphate isomerase n=1 Tax=Oceanibaculum indicum P24 TaxID=1207063 RepID=K2K441_9PROT|nr:triose-phosphate isomerase [Oceanibaculum indicum]EKE77679.1 Triose-phosphate isomerase [Oceanibaculum indicum P24]
MAPRKLIAGNWKMNLLKAEGEALVRALGGSLSGTPKPACDVLVCPPFTLLGALAPLCRETGLALGAQDCHAKSSGAFTGDVAAPMLADAGCSHVIVGHSERRSLHGEDNATVKAKAEAALAAGLVAIVCVGETEAERDSGKAEEIVVAQLLASLPQGASAKTLVVAYEPVWAIGTGRTPTVEQVADMHAALRKALGGVLSDAAGLRLLYGGSVKPGNAAELLAVANVDGALVGGASLSHGDFWAICQSCG